MKEIPALTRILGRCGDYFTPLSERDMQMMEKLQSGTKDGGKIRAEISQIVIEEGKQIRILSGPLRNLEGQIKKLNLHKRIAEVELEFMGSKSVVYLGIEMVERLGEEGTRRESP